MSIIPKSDFDCTGHALPILHENNLVEKNYIPPRLFWSASDFAHSQGGKKAIAYLACVISLLHTDDCVCSQAEMIFF